jgi:hypothetical protein
MALVVEDGSGKTDADSYLSVADCDAYHTNHSASATWSGASTADKEKALRLATQYLDARYERRFVGVRFSREQSLHWPRSYVQQYDIYTISTTTIPQELKDATAELALKQLSDTDLAPDVASGGNIAEEEVSVGSVKTRTKYVGQKGSAKEYTLVRYLLQPLLRQGIERS